METLSYEARRQPCGECFCFLSVRKACDVPIVSGRNIYASSEDTLLLGVSESAQNIEKRLSRSVRRFSNLLIWVFSSTLHVQQLSVLKVLLESKVVVKECRVMNVVSGWINACFVTHDYGFVVCPVLSCCVHMFVSSTNWLFGTERVKCDDVSLVCSFCGSLYVSSPIGGRNVPVWMDLVCGVKEVSIVSHAPWTVSERIGVVFCNGIHPAPGRACS